MTEVIVRCLKLQLATWIFRLRLHIKHCTELCIAVAVGFVRAALLGKDDRPRFLNMNLQGVMRPQKLD